MNFSKILPTRFVLRFVGVAMVTLTLVSILVPQSNLFTPFVWAVQGYLITMAGNGNEGFSGDGASATSAELAFPNAIAVDADKNIYISDSVNNRIRKVTFSTGLISTVAGSGSSVHSGDGSAAIDAGMSPNGVAVDSAGDIYISDGVNKRVRKVTVSTGIISTIAGDGTSTYSGDSGLAIAAGVFPFAIAVDSAGDIYIAGHHRIRKVSAGNISTVAGSGDGGILDGGYSGDGGPATSAELNTPNGVAVDSDGNIYISDANNRIRKVTISTGFISTIAGSGATSYSGDGGSALSAGMSADGVGVDSDGNIYIADLDNQRIRKVTVSSGNISTVAGNGLTGYEGTGLLATSTRLNQPNDVFVDDDDNVYISDSSNHVVRRIDGPTFPLPPGTSSTATDAEISIDVNDFLSFSIANIAVGDEPAGDQPLGAGDDIVALASTGSNTYAISGEFVSPVYTQLQTTTNSTDGYSVTAYAHDSNGRTAALLRQGGSGGTAADQVADSVGVLGDTQSENDVLNTAVDTGLAFRLTSENTSAILFGTDEADQWGEDDESNALWASFPIGSGQARVIYSTQTFSAAPTVGYINWFVGVGSEQQTGLYNAMVTFSASVDMGGGGGGGGGGEE
jgi:sugar lactone lactonase YvrE